MSTYDKGNEIISHKSMPCQWEGWRMNQEIRKRIQEAGLKQWQVAMKCGVTEYTFIRWLRVELSEERKNTIYQAIEALSQKGE